MDDFTQLKLSLFLAQTNILSHITHIQKGPNTSSIELNVMKTLLNMLPPPIRTIFMGSIEK